MEHATKDTGSKIFNMDLVKKSGLMEASTKETMYLERNMERERIHGLMVPLMMETGTRIGLRALDCTLGSMEGGTRALG